MQYVYGWLFYVLATLGLLYPLWRLTALLLFMPLRQLLLLTVVVLLLVPAPIPEYQGYYAPAILVAVFETFFQQPGNPAFALFVLKVSCAILWIFLLLWWLRVWSLVSGLWRHSRKKF